MSEKTQAASASSAARRSQRKIMKKTWADEPLWMRTVVLPLSLLLRICDIARRVGGWSGHFTLPRRWTKWRGMFRRAWTALERADQQHQQP